MKGGNHNPNGRPTILIDPVAVNVNIEAATLAYIDRLAKDSKRTRSETIRSLLRHQIEIE